MAKVDEQLMTFVEEEMKNDPDISSKDLFEKAKAAVTSAAELNLREFHARYPLQVKRKASLAKGGGRRRKRKGRAGTRRGRGGASQAAREAIRATLLTFATDLSAAEARKDLVKVLARVDDYVDAVLDAARS